MNNSGDLGTRTDTARVVLARHGETEWSKDGRHTGLSDIPLTAKGEDQARALRAALAHRTFGKVLVSPLARATRTAELAGLAGYETDPDLTEWDYGDYEGRTTRDISAELGRPWSIWSSGVEKDPALGESVEAVGARADAVFARLGRAVDRGEDVLLVAHGHLLRVLTARWLRLPAADGALFALDTGTLSELGYEHDEPVIEVWNAPV